MKKILSNLIKSVIISLIVIGITDVKAQNKEIQAVKLNKKLVTVLGENVKVSLKIDTVQQLSDKGIKFSIKLKNISNDSIKIYNVLDMLSFALMNESGQNVAIPHVSKNLLHNATGVYQYKAFVVEQVKSDDKEENKKMEGEKFISIKSKGTFEIVLRIAQTLGPDKAKSYADNAFQPLSKGKYILIIALGLKGERNVSQPTDPDNTGELLALPMVTIAYGN